MLGIAKWQIDTSKFLKTFFIRKKKVDLIISKSNEISSSSIE